MFCLFYIFVGLFQYICSRWLPCLGVLHQDLTLILSGSPVLLILRTYIFGASGEESEPCAGAGILASGFSFITIKYLDEFFPELRI